MSDSIIEVKNISKKYTIGHEQLPYHSLRDDIVGLIKKPIRWLRGHRETHEPFWALKDINFEVKKGEVLGIIGANGAGKSTLLKILSRITYPTTGEIKIHGRVGSLLEVGTGFHPELTGRENIYLNGAILGMAQDEIRRKFDEIVDFAGIEKFLDTPVKHYSSGMYVRLAFSVAAYLEPDILIIDEVLAVGDADFQKKCLGKMEEITKKGGRTIIFVSHNMGAVRNLCTSALLLSQGKIISRGNVGFVIDSYLQANLQTQGKLIGPVAVNGDLGITLESFRVLNDRGVEVVAMESGNPGSLELIFFCEKKYSNCIVSIGIESIEGIRIGVLHNITAGFDIAFDKPKVTIRCTMPKVPLFPGRYRLSIKLATPQQTIFYLTNIFELLVENGDFFGTGRLPDKNWGGVVLISHNWLVT